MVEQHEAQVTVSKEVARAGVERVPVRVARLQRVVVRETRTVEVEVAHEEYRVVYEEIDAAAGAAPAGAAGSGLRTATTVLREERIELVRRIVPVERVTLHLDQVRTDAIVPVTLRHEEVDLETLPADAPQRGA